MKLVAFAKDREHPEISTRLHDRDDGWARLLRQKGFSVEGVSWDDKNVDWNKFDLVVVRSAHDYIFRVEEFRGWLQRLVSLRVNLFNPPEISTWNLHKSYLADLKRKRIRIPESVFINRNQDGIKLAQLMRQKGFTKAVVKPCIAVGSYEAHLVSGEEAVGFQTKFENLVGNMDMIVQEYVEEITTNGEWGLIYFNKIYSHAILKRPAPGDFRAFFMCGGTVAAAEAPENVRRFCDNVIAAIESPLLFSRVDSVEKDDGTVVLMELELLDTALYFDKDTTGKAEKLAADVVEKILG